MKPKDTRREPALFRARAGAAFAARPQVRGFNGAAGLLAGVFGFERAADFERFAQLFAVVDAERKLGGGAEAPTPQCQDQSGCGIGPFGVFPEPWRKTSG
jgi:hypothetical protein